MNWSSLNSFTDFFYEEVEEFVTFARTVLVKVAFLAAIHALALAEPVLAFLSVGAFE